ncbi:MAG: tRNA uracil 4-sulfurtransferase ThiI [Minisyncoccales bacterium]
MKIKEGILIGFGELFLKSRSVQEIFKKKLFFQISFFLKKENIDFVFFPKRERFFFQIKKEDQEKAENVLKRIFGLSFFAPAFLFEATEKEIINSLSEFLKKNFKKFIKKNESFALRLKKEKDFFLSRQKVIEKLAKNIKRKVDLERPKKEIFVELRKNYSFLYFKKIKGLGGLPFSTSGKVLSLISGGIDSPVASFLMLKKGCENVWLHFHSFPLVSNRSILKVNELAKIFLKFQPSLTVYFCPFGHLQIKMKNKIPPKYLVIFYRMFMLKIAREIAKKEKCLAIVTGESLGQVSSQTLDNIKVLEEKINFPIFRPLIEKDKEEIVKMAKEIKTFPISIQAQEDCCTLFTPRHSSAKVNLSIIKRLEKKIDLKREIKEILKKTKKEIFK